MMIPLIGESNHLAGSVAGIQRNNKMSYYILKNHILAGIRGYLAFQLPARIQYLMLLILLNLRIVAGIFGPGPNPHYTHYYMYTLYTILGNRKITSTTRNNN
jgi:hypothetical protein